MTTIFDGLPFRAAECVDGPNAAGYFTAGIDIGCQDIFGKPDWHLHAIEFHSKDSETAVRRRDAVIVAMLKGN